MGNIQKHMLEISFIGAMHPPTSESLEAYSITRKDYKNKLSAWAAEIRKWLALICLVSQFYWFTGWRERIRKSNQSKKKKKKQENREREANGNLQQLVAEELQLQFVKIKI